ncbi:preprotein translocase subunit SecY [Phytomonospora endophytica]|uniref:Preprotein translocase subunit SecY n=1 Tax=Phytomonospora endophytica TaxID=714109 RepID=A0A841FWQ2_9ACTN|nr:hypothetical protein [Phytomonospora endophytica]MBB6038158.1 preprotein translocase subunit SecY [Phytomonospora endophytica]GIG67379.1 protein translocase subunit SecY [Phytomonospora endophytica]
MPAVPSRIVRRVLVTLFLIAVFRLGQYIPLPYTDADAVTDDPGPARALLELVSGGAVGRLSVFALGIYPFFFAISAMTVVVGASPRLTALAAEGKAGMRRLLFYRRVLAVAIGAALGAAMVAAGEAGYFGDGAFVATGWGSRLLIVGCLAVATAVVMLIAEGVHRHGYGPASVSLALMSLLAGIAEEFAAVLARRGPVVLAVLTAAVLAAVVGRVWVSQAQRRVPIGYEKRMVGRRPGVTPTYLPLHLVVRGDKSLLVATVVLLVPPLAGDIAGFDGLAAWSVRDPWYAVAFALLLAIITFASTMSAHDLTRQVDRLRRTGGFVPGIRPGRPTGEYLGHVLVRLALAGAVLWTSTALLPLGAGVISDTGVMFSALLPVTIFYTVEAALRTGREIQTEMFARRYAGMLR